MAKLHTLAVAGIALSLSVSGCKNNEPSPTANDAEADTGAATTGSASASSASAAGAASASSVSSSVNGSNGAYSFAGSVTGRADIEHVFSADKGQTIDIEIDAASNPYFNVIPPGGTYGDAIFVGSAAADPMHWSGVVPASGDYRVLVYLRGDARDADETRPYAMKVRVQ